MKAITSARPASRTVCMIRRSCSEIDCDAVEHEDGDLGPVDRGGGAQRGVVLVARGLLDPLADAGGVDEPPGRGRPASISSSTGSTVVPATSSTTTRSSPASLFSSEDLPTFGLPTMAIRRGPPTSPKAAPAAARAARPGRRRAGRRSRGRAARRPGTARRARGSTGRRPRPRRAGRRPCWRPARPACRTCRRTVTTASSASVMPTVASTTNSTASASVDRDLGLGARSARPCPRASGSQPPVSTTVKRAAGPVGVVGHPVAGHARDVLDDGLAAADDPVDQRGLADVGAADDGEHGHRAGAGARRRRARLVVMLVLVGDAGGRGRVVRSTRRDRPGQRRGR